MLRAAVSKVMWVGRATVFLVGLAVIVGLIFGAASMALGADGKPFLLGKNNLASALTKLTSTHDGSAMQIQSDSTGTNDTALNLNVQPGEAPMHVNSTTKVGSLNSDLLDGKDSSAFGIKTAQNFSFSEDCDEPATWNECAPVEVTVPAGKTYLVSVWSSFTGKGGASNQNILFCSARKGPGPGTPSCITPFGFPSEVTIEANQFSAAAASGESDPLSEGTYVFSTLIRPEERFASDPAGSGKTITKVLVRDASGATVSSASVSEQGAALRER